MSEFVDRVRLRVKGGDGGSGMISFRREAHVPRGGPDGGDGGRGGSVVLSVDPGLTTLAELRFAREHAAPDGADGSKKDRSGKRGADLVLRVPPGTIVRDRASGETVVDMVGPGDEVVIARGGRGGRGNARFATSVRRVPRIAEDGEPGESRELELELKLIADIGLVGLPNAGKSSLLAALTRATPKIAAYPFTTLVPNLGVARLEERELVLADIPGLIEGAHDGVGLGEEFLRHIERTRLIVHVVDAAAEDPLADIRILEQELRLHGHGLLELPRMYALNKMDLPDAREHLPLLQEHLGEGTLPISAATGEGVPAVLKRIFALCGPRAVETTAPAVRRITLSEAGRGWTIVREGEGYRVRDGRLERLASGLDWADPDASAYFHRLLVRTGVDRALRAKGVKTGDTVKIGKRELEWSEAPTV
ncbi:MAG: GTPase ObgE [Chloroflexi bacterium]|nr:GTPase ObgE [Chloroflexota bacterium]